MDPLVRLTFFMSRLWGNPRLQRKALMMIVGLGAAIAVVSVEQFGWWPESWRVNPRVTQPGISRS